MRVDACTRGARGMRCEVVEVRRSDECSAKKNVDVLPHTPSV